MTSLKTKSKLNPGSHKVIKQLRRNGFHPIKEVPVSLIESWSNDGSLLQQTPLGQSRSKMDTLLLLWIDSPVDGWRDLQCIWHVRRCWTQQFELTWRMQHKQNRKCSELCHKLFTPKFCGRKLQRLQEKQYRIQNYLYLNWEVQMNYFKSIFRLIHIQ